MKLGRSLLALGLAAVIVSRALAAPGDVGKLIEYRTAGYTLTSSGDPMLMRTVIQELGRFDRLLALTLKRESVDDGVPTRFHMVSSGVWRDYLETNYYITSTFKPLRFANVAVANGDLTRANTRLMLQHDYTHVFLRRTSSGYLPWWFHEGFADLMMSAKIEGRNASFGFPWAVRPGEWLHVGKVLEMQPDAPQLAERPELDPFRYEAWVLVHRGLIGDPQFSAKMFNYLQAVNNLRPTDQAVQEGFGMTTDALDREVRNAVTRRTWRTSEHDLGTVPRVVVEAERTLSPLESARTIATLALDLGVDPARVGPLIAALDGDPQMAAAGALLRMRVALAKRDDAALQGAFESLKERIAEPEVAREAGLVLFERTRVVPDPAAGIRERARELLDRSLGARPDDPEAAWAYAQLCAESKVDTSRALERLTRARTRMPRHPDLAMATAQLLEVEGRGKELQAALIETAKLAQSLEQRRWAAQKLLDLRPRAAP